MLSGLYSSLLWYPTLEVLRHGSQFYLQITPCLPLPRKRSADGASSDWWRTSNCSLLLIYVLQKDKRPSRPGWLTYSGVNPRKWSPVSCRSSAGLGKFAGQRPTFYHCAMQPRFALKPVAEICFEKWICLQLL